MNTKIQPKVKTTSTFAETKAQTEALNQEIAEYLAKRFPAGAMANFMRLYVWPLIERRYWPRYVSHVLPIGTKHRRTGQRWIEVQRETDPEKERKRLKRERAKDLRWLAREKEKEAARAAMAQTVATLKGE
jgi:hypothetical protein